MAKEQLYTPEGYQKLIDELDYLKNTKREEVKNDIAVARSFGDLSENAEYDEARNEQAKVEARIKELEELIENAVVIDESQIDTSIASIGSMVKVEEDGEIVEYSIVGSNEADPFSCKISDLSPMGKAIIGKHAGTTVHYEVEVNGEKREFSLKILEVTR